MLTEIQIRGVPEEVKIQLKRSAAAQGSTMSEYLLRVICEDLALPTREEWLARLRSTEPVELDRPVAETLRAVREGEAR